MNNMIFALALLLAGATSAQGKTQCGKWYSSDCVGDTDIRYDPDHTIDLKELAPIWAHYEGFWINDMGPYINTITERIEDGATPYNSARKASNGNLPYPFSGSRGFYNITIEGSRLMSPARYYVFPPASPEFCDQSLPPGFSNVIGNGTCGVTGYSLPAGTFGTSTHEKDGRIKMFEGTGVYSSSDERFEVDASRDAYRVPVDERTFTQSSTSPAFLTSQSNVFLNNFTQISGAQLIFILSTPPGPRVFTMIMFNWRKVTEQEWLDEIAKAYDDFNVLPEDRVQGGQLPMQTACLTICPTEEEWCSQDPACSESPYQEPDASIEAGPIAGILVAVFVVLLGVLYLLHRAKLAKQSQRFRNQFARRIAETVKLRGSTRQLSPDGLVKEFGKIGASGDKITKEELWAFMQSGKAGTLDEGDFDALFAALDTDKSGTVDFLEFCSFMGKCNDEFEGAKNRPSILAVRESSRDLLGGRRSDLAASIARRYSTSMSQLFAVEDVEQEETEKDASVTEKVNDKEEDV